MIYIHMFAVVVTDIIISPCARSDNSVGPHCNTVGSVWPQSNQLNEGVIHDILCQTLPSLLILIVNPACNEPSISFERLSPDD